MGQYHYSPPLGICFSHLSAHDTSAVRGGIELKYRVAGVNPASYCRVEKWYLVWLITRRLSVQVRPLHPLCLYGHLLGRNIPHGLSSASVRDGTSTAVKIGKHNMRWNNTKQEISLSPSAVSIINRLLSNGEEVKIDVNQKTHELMIFKVPRKKMEYKVVIAERR